MSNRRSISAEVSRQVLIESGHRCAVCGDSCPLERAHIIPFCDSHDHAFANLICLCANCHERADKEHWGERILRKYKRLPWVRRKYTDPATAEPNMTKLEISIAMDYKDFDQRSENLLQHGLASFLEIPPKNVEVKWVGEGSVRIAVMLPELEAERLVHAYEINDPALSEHLAPFSLLGIRRDAEGRERLQRRQKMPEGKKRCPFLIIDNQDTISDAGFWKRLAEEQNVRYTAVIRDTKQEILAELQQILTGETNFVGTILDIIYRGQTTGGIELWEELVTLGLATRCGHLFVSTKQQSGEVIDFANKYNAMLNTKLTKQHKRIAFMGFLKVCDIRPLKPRKTS